MCPMFLAKSSSVVFGFHPKNTGLRIIVKVVLVVIYKFNVADNNNIPPI